MEDHFTDTGALTALQMRHLPDEVTARVMDAVRNGTGKVELRTRVDSEETELVLVPADGSDALWLTRMTPPIGRSMHVVRPSLAQS